jgi:hypothetical protein
MVKRSSRKNLRCSAKRELDTLLGKRASLLPDSDSGMSEKLVLHPKQGESPVATPNYLLLAVKNPLASAELYTQIFGSDPVERSPTFVLFALPNGLKVGLWSAADMKPEPGPAGGVEISFSLPDPDSVRQAHQSWKRLGLRVMQEPTHLDFGYTCVLEDSDGHRLRPFVLSIDPR